jgi:TPR repeat protein
MLRHFGDDFRLAKRIIAPKGLGAVMKLLDTLAVAAAIALLAFSLGAQESLPDSYLQKLATIDRLQKLTSTDLEVLESRAQSGAAEAQYQLALVYGAGRIVPRDTVTSQRLMMRSAKQGYIPAETMIGCRYLDNHVSGPVPKYADAERWLRAAATQGDAEAQLWLGLGYDRGYFGRTDHQESLKWLRRSAAQGLPDAQVALAQMYEDGRGVSRSDEDAAYWYRRAADHFSDVSGVFQAETELAYMYRDGRLKRNDVEAYMWFAIIDDSVDPPTDEGVKELAEEMTPVQIAEAQANVTVWIKHHPPRPR